MKVVVMNFSGNVGKSVISSNMLLPRIKNAELVAVETINADEGSQALTIKAKQFRTLRDALFVNDSIIADIGASNVEETLGQMIKYEGSHEDVDCFLIPTTPVAKQVNDTVSTVVALVEQLGVPAKKIKIVFNKIDDEDNFSSDFAKLLNVCDSVGVKYHENAIIRENEVYQLARAENLNIFELANDKNDYRAMFKAATDEAEKARCIRMVSLVGLAKSANRDLDNAFNLLFGKTK